MDNDKNIIVADIGGTNSRFAHFRISGGDLEMLSTLWLKTKEFSSFETLMTEVGRSSQIPAPEDTDMGVIAIAGPVMNDTYSAPPLIGWSIDISKHDYGFRQMALINDFVAQAYACLGPVGHNATVVHEGAPEAGATIATIGAGTGLGKAALVAGHGSYTPMASEGGHASFSFHGHDEFRYYEFLMQKLDIPYPIPNTVVSGSGLSLLHEFLTGQVLSPADAALALPENPDTLNWFARFYARIARDFALETLCTGGLFIAGGIAAKNPIMVQCPAFRPEFILSEHHSGMLSSIPIRLINNQDSGLWGAAHLGMMALDTQGHKSGEQEVH